MSSDKFHCVNGHCLTDCALSSIDYDKDLPPRFCPYSGGVVCWKKRETNEKKPSLFDKITASPEVLAEKFVYCKEPEHFCESALWCSVLLGDVAYAKREQAITATVAELKGGGDE